MDRKIDRIYFELTTMCNLRCKHCFNFNDNFKADVLTLEDIKLFYEKVKNKTNGMVLTGGEPFLHPQIKEIIAMLHSERVVITTNATLYDGNYYEEILKRNPNVFLQVSFDGMSKEVYEEVRGKNTYDKVKGVIDYLSERGYGERMGLSMSILACNIHEVMDVIEYAKKCRLHSVHFPTLIMEGRCAEDATILPKVEELNQIEDKLLQAIVENENLNISVNTLNRIAGWVMGGKEQDCLSNATVKITADGSIMPCPVAWKSTESIGNIKTISCFDDLLEQIRNVKTTKTQKEECKSCDAQKLCNQNFCEFCLVRKTNLKAGREYRCSNYAHHISNLMKERMNEQC